MTATAPRTVVHDPDSVWPYGWEWAGVLAELDTTLADAEVLVPDGLTLVSTDVTGSRVTATISGGTAGETYKVTCRATFADGPPWVQDATRELMCRER